MDPAVKESKAARSHKSRSKMHDQAITLCASAYLNTMSHGIGYTIGTLFVDWAQTFESSKHETAWVVSLCLGLSFFTGPLSASICAAFGNRVAAVVGSVLATVGLATSAFCTHIYQLYLTLGVLAGVGFGITMTPSLNIGGHFTKHRSRAMATISTAAGICIFIFPYLIRAASDVLGWRGAHFVIASLVVQGCVMGSLLRPPPQKKVSRHEPPQRKKNQKPPKPWWKMLSLCKDVSFVLCFTGALCIGLGGNTLPAVVVDYAVDVGMSRQEGAQLLSLVGVGGLCGRMAVLPLMCLKVLKNRSFVMVIAGGLTRGLGTALCAISTSYPVLSVTCFLFGLGIGMQICSVAPMIVELYGPKNYHHYIGMFYGGLGLGTLFGAPITGLFVDVMGNYSLPLYLSGAACFFSGIIHMATVYLLRSTVRIAPEGKHDQGGFDISVIYTNQFTETTPL